MTEAAVVQPSIPQPALPKQTVPQPTVSQRAAMGAGWIIAWRMATRNLGLISTLILVRLLRPSDFGLVALATGFINSVDALSAIGVQDALVRAPSPDRDMYDTGFGLSVLRGFLTALLIAILAWPLGAFFDEPRLAVVMLALSAGTLITAFENIGIVDFRRDLAFRKEFDMQLWSRVIGVISTIAVAVIWRTYWALVVGILVYRTARLIQSYVMSPYRPRITIRAWRRLIGFSLWTWAQTMLSQARERSDSIVVGRILGATQVGVFSVGFELGSLPATEVVEPLGRALFSGFASLHNAAEGLANMFLGAVGLGFLMILPAGIGISMIADPMVRLTLGTQWGAAVPVVEIMAVVGTMAIFTQACATLLNAIGRPSVAFYISTASTTLRVVMLLVLVPSFGLTGAAWALGISAVLDLILFLAITLPLAEVSLFRLLGWLVRPIIATTAMVGVLWWLGLAWTPAHSSDTAQLLIDASLRSGIGAACYVAALAALWLLMGRPEGAEQHGLTMIRRTWTRIVRRR